MHAKGNITCKSTVEKLHIWGSPAWILENLMFLYQFNFVNQFPINCQKKSGKVQQWNGNPKPKKKQT